MHRRHLALLIGILAALGLMVSGVAGASSQAKVPKPGKGGTIIFGADQEPNLLNTFIVGGDHFWAGQITGTVIVGAHVLTPAFVFKPYLIKKVKVQQNPFRLTYYIKKNANWYSPGKKTVPVTAADFIFTWRTIMNKNWEILGTVGYEDIKKATVINSKTVRFTFSKPFAGYKTLFGQVLPAFALRGEDFNKTWINNINNPKTDKPISNGPLYLTSWQRGRQANLSPNPTFSASVRTRPSKIVVRFLPDTNTTAQQIRGGEVDVIYPQPQAFLVPLRSVKSLRIQVGLGPVWEHIDINMGFKKGDPLLQKRFIREALIRGINRTAIVDALYHKTKIAPSLPVLNSLILVTNQKGYKPWFAKYKYSVSQAQAILRKNGCTKSGDFFSCNGQKLSFRLSTTGGNQLRVLAEEIIQQQLKAVGIDINIVNDPGRLLFSQRIPDGNYDLAMYAWVGSPDITGWDNVYGCRNDATQQAQQNRQGYCNKKVDKYLQTVNHTFSDKGQLNLTNKAVKLMANDINVIPLFQKPTYLIHKRSIKGPNENPTSAGPTWNIEFWYKTSA